MKDVAAATNAAEKAARAADKALPVRLQLARDWEQLITHQLAATDTHGEMGTIANLEQQSRRTLHMVDGHDRALVEALGRPLPAEAQPVKTYLGVPRIIVPTVRDSVRPGEAVSLRIVALDRQPVMGVLALVRPLGRGDWQAVKTEPVGRAVWRATLPAAAEDYEYRIEALTADARKLVWPATARRSTRRWWWRREGRRSTASAAGCAHGARQHRGNVGLDLASSRDTCA